MYSKTCMHTPHSIRLHGPEQTKHEFLIHPTAAILASQYSSTLSVVLKPIAVKTSQRKPILRALGGHILRASIVVALALGCATVRMCVCIDMHAYIAHHTPTWPAWRLCSHPANET